MSTEFHEKLEEIRNMNGRERREELKKLQREVWASDMPAKDEFLAEISSVFEFFKEEKNRKREFWNNSQEKSEEILNRLKKLEEKVKQSEYGEAVSYVDEMEKSKKTQVENGNV